MSMLKENVSMGYERIRVQRAHSVSLRTSLLKQSAPESHSGLQKLRRESELAEQTQRVACTNLEESLQSTWGNTIVWDPLLFITVQTSLPQAFLRHREERQTTRTARKTPLVAIALLTSFKQFLFESSMSITSGRMQIQYIVYTSFMTFFFSWVNVTAASPL